jgi:uncharacterized lipoprotein YddW (UPF0748 family)
MLFLLLQNISAQTPKHEIRAVWITTISGLDWPHAHAAASQQKELTDILDKLQQANINTVLIQARVRASTIYPSTQEPWDICLTGTAGKSPGYDPLQFCIEECHKRGMECHAWIVTIPVGKWTADGCKKLRARYPNLIQKIGDEGYMDPEKSQTGDYLAQICADVTRRYDVDGIHLDYIRYPETWKLKVSRSQGRQNITNIVKKIHKAVKTEKPWVKLSCSPVGKYDDLSRYQSLGWNANTTVCQDAQGWLRAGLMDALFPMMYFQGNHFYPFVVDWKEHSYGRMLAPGLAIYMLHPREKNWDLDVIRREMNVLRQQGLGVTFFRSKFLTDNVKDVYNFTKDFNRSPALVPPMSWVSGSDPRSVAQFSVSHGTASDVLTWQGARPQNNGNNLLYNIYASDSYPVDTEDPACLVATRLQGQSITIPHQGRSLNYAITAIDRYGRESSPSFSTQAAPTDRPAIDFRQLIMGKPSTNILKSTK